MRRLWRWFTGLLNGRETMDEFGKRFPGQCLICSYRRYGVFHGFVDAHDPVPLHRCKDRPNA